jgi:hypothetical protein
MTETGFNDPTAQRLERISTGADRTWSARCSPTSSTIPRWRECDVALISGGKSNLTYRVACDAGEIILRRPPLGHILPTAHDMAREYRVLTRSMAPPSRSADAVPGRRARRAVLRDGARARARLPQRAARTGTPIRRTTARDRRGARRRARRAAFGRSGRGRAGRVRRPEGFMARLLRRWSQQWEASRMEDVPAP